MLKPATSDKNFTAAMERFVNDPADFGPQDLMVVFPNIGATADEAAFKIDRQKMREQAAEHERKMAEERAAWQKEKAEMQAKLDAAAKSGNTKRR